MGRHEVELRDGSAFLYCWYVTITPDLSECNAHEAVNFSSVNLDDYYVINALTTYNESENLNPNAERMLGAPLVYGASDDFAGAWFNAFLYLVVIVFVYGKSHRIELASIVTLIISSTVIVAELTGATNYPTAFLTFIYITGVLGIVGVFYGIFGGD